MVVKADFVSLFDAISRGFFTEIEVEFGRDKIENEREKGF